MTAQEVHLGFIGVLSNADYASGLQRTLAAYTAMKMINNASANIIGPQVLPGINVTINLRIADDEGNAQIGTSRAWDLVTTGHHNFDDPHDTLPVVVGIIGPMWSSVAKPVALLTNIASVQIVSMSATTPELSDKSEYPNFCRVLPSDSFEATIMGAFVQHFGWKQVIILSCNDVFCVGMSRPSYILDVE